jgi:hypothetical protein
LGTVEKDLFPMEVSAGEGIFTASFSEGTFRIS